MKPIVLPMQELKPALTGFGKVINRHQPLPVLNHIKVERTKDGWVALTCTDLDTFATLRLEQPTDGEPFAVLVPFDTLSKVAKNCTKTDTVTIFGNEKLISVKYPVGTGTMESEAETLPVEEFPETPKFKGDSIPLPETLRSSIHEALQCASDDETRLILNSAFIDVSDKKGHYVVGTNGRHLYASNSFALPLNESVILPTHRFLGFKDFNNDGEWQLKVGEKPDKDSPAPIQLTSRRWRFITRQHDGNYPNWRQVIVKDFTSTIEFDAASLEMVIQTIERMPDHDPMYHTIGIELKNQRVNLLCKATKDQPKWTPVEIKDVKTSGKDVTLYVNRHYFTKALSFGLNRLDLTDALSPVRFSKGGRQLIVMPVRVEADPQSKPAAPPAEKPQPAAQTDAAPKKEETMPENNGTLPSATQSLDAQLDQCLDDIEALKEAAQEQVSSLTSLRAKLKIIQREHKASTKELQTVRQTLKSLQTVKL